MAEAVGSKDVAEFENLKIRGEVCGRVWTLLPHPEQAEIKNNVNSVDDNVL